MANTILINGLTTGSATTSGSTTFTQLTCGLVQSTTENQFKIRFRSAGTLSQFYMRTTVAPSATLTCRVRINGNNGTQLISINNGQSGEFEDTSGSDSVAAGDEVNYSLNSAAAATTITVTIMSMLFAATTNTVSILAIRAGDNFTTASTTFFRSLAGSQSTTDPTENNANCRQRKAGTLKNLGCFLSANTRGTDSTFKIRKNDGDGNLDAAVTANTTGWFEDTSESDTVSAGEDWNYGYLTGSGTGNNNVEMMKVEFESTAGDGQIIMAVPGTAPLFADNTTRHLTMGGHLGTGETAATNLRAETNVAIDFTEMSVLVPLNTASTTSTITLWKDGADTTLVVSVTADGTGVFTTASTVSFTAAQETSIEVTVPTEGGTNNLSIQMISLWTNIAAASNLERAPATETVTISDSVVRVYGQVRTIATETVTSSESIARMLASTRTLPETTTSAETLTRILSAMRPIDAETTAIADAVTRVKGIPRSIDTETVTISDSVARMLAANRTLQEDTIVSETVTRLLAANRSLATETTSIADSVTRVFGAVRAPATETVTVSDSVTRLLAATRTIQTETTVITDAVARLLAANRALLESTVITDSVVGLQQGPGQANLERSISETVVISDSVTRLVEATRTIVAETVTINDTVTRQTTATRTIDAEITSIIDTVQRSCGRVRTIAAETVAVTDSVVRSVGRVRTLTETVNVSDGVTRLLAATRQMLETVSQLDSLSRLLAASRSIQTETVSVSDSVTRLLTRVRSIVENVNINDAITRAFVGARPILESIPIIDTLTRTIIPFEIPTRLKKIRQWLTSKYDIGDPSL